MIVLCIRSVSGRHQDQDISWSYVIEQPMKTADGYTWAVYELRQIM